MCFLFIGCGKKRFDLYVANISQSGTENPTVDVLKDKTSGIKWIRSDKGIYIGKFKERHSGQIVKFIDPTSDVHASIRIYSNESEIQIYSQIYNYEFQSWEFSDDVLKNTSIEVRIYK